HDHWFDNPADGQNLVQPRPKAGIDDFRVRAERRFDQAFLSLPQRCLRLSGHPVTARGGLQLLDRLAQSAPLASEVPDLPTHNAYGQGRRANPARETRPLHRMASSSAPNSITVGRERFGTAMLVSNVQSK